MQILVAIGSVEASPGPK